MSRINIGIFAGGCGFPHLLLAICLCLCLLATSATAWTGRRAVLYAEAEVMLALNEAYVPGKKDCSSQMWRLMNRVFPELRAVKWFRRTTAEAMASWPWDALLTLNDLFFGDLLFANSEEYDRPDTEGRRRVRPIGADFKINHVLMSWTDPAEAIHAGKKRGFSRTNLRPYWQPKIVLAVRPPY